MEVPERTIAWLLEDDTPPVALRTRTDLLDEGDRSAGVRRIRGRLMDYPVTRAILAQGDRFWHDEANSYRKYTGRYWQVMFLGWFLADGSAPAIREGVAALLTDRAWVSAAGGQCLTANLLAAFTRLGYGAHPAVRDEREALAARVLADGGVRCDVMDYSLLRRCHMSIPKLLLCFALTPPADRTATIADATALLAGHLVDRHVLDYVPGTQAAWQEVLARAPKRAELSAGETVKGWVAAQREAFLAEHGYGERREKRGWTRFGFPLHYNSDALEAMVALARVGTPMRNELRRPLELIASKAGPDARWVMENSLNGKMLADVERKGEPSKWLTYFALTTLRHFDGLDIR